MYEMQPWKWAQHPRWRIIVIHAVAGILGVTVHIDGWPLGSGRLLRRQIKKRWGAYSFPGKNNNGENRDQEDSAASPADRD